MTTYSNYSCWATVESFRGCCYFFVFVVLTTFGFAFVVMVMVCVIFVYGITHDDQRHCACISSFISVVMFYLRHFLCFSFLVLRLSSVLYQIPTAL